MRAMVWVDDWQLQCCGEPFAVGQEVAWTLATDVDTDWLQSVVGAETTQRIAYREEHHGGVPDDTPLTHGRVLSIRTACCRFQPIPGGDGRTLYPESGSGEVQEVYEADGWEPETPGLHFVGYIVELDILGQRAVRGAER